MMIRDFKHSLYAVLFVMFFAACGGEDDNNGTEGGKDTTEQSNNANKNDATADAALARLEFPKLKGGSSVVIVHRTNGDTQYDKDCVNYAVEWDTSKKSQRWSCYQMHSGYTGNYSRVVDGYLSDPNLSDDEYWDDDYFYGSGYDHGHICPNADRKYSELANKQTFYLTNMQPQYRKFNGYSSTGSDQGNGLWLRLETEVRNWTPTSSGDTLYVCKGGTIDNEADIIERIQGKLIVPKYFFVVCLMKNSLGYRAIAFFMEQKNQWGDNEDLTDYAKTVDWLEERTGIDFFCNLPDDIENDVESKLSLLSWGLK